MRSGRPCVAGSMTRRRPAWRAGLEGGARARVRCAIRPRSSVDLDLQIRSSRPGVGSPVTGGFSYREAHLALELVAESGLLTSLELAEVNQSSTMRTQQRSWQSSWRRARWERGSQRYAKARAGSSVGRAGTTGLGPGRFDPCRPTATLATPRNHRPGLGERSSRPELAPTRRCVRNVSARSMGRQQQSARFVGFSAFDDRTVDPPSSLPPAPHRPKRPAVIDSFGAGSGAFVALRAYGSMWVTSYAGDAPLQAVTSVRRNAAT